MVVHFQKPIKVFYCYARADKKFCDDLDQHLGALKRAGMIQTWSDRDIALGTDWKVQIADRIDQSDIILLLVSPDFIASDYAFGVEMRQAMEQQESKRTRIIPVLLRPTISWQTTPFGKLHSLPTDAKPVTDWKDSDAAFADIAYGIRRVVNELQEASAAQIDWVDKGDRLLQLNNHKEALAAYEQAIHLAPVNDMAYVGKGNVLRNLGRSTEALTAYEKAIRIAPNNVFAYMGRGNVLHDLGRPTESLAAYRTAARLEPNNGAVYREMGNVLYDLDIIDEALEAYEQAIHLTPNDIVTYISRGNVFQALHRYEEALANYDRALLLFPNNITAHFYRGEVLLHLHQYENALQDYQRALVLEPRNIPAYMGRGNALVQLHRYKEAVADYDVAILLDPNNANAYYAKATTLRNLDQTDEALLAYEQARKLGLNVEKDLMLLYRQRTGAAEVQPLDTRIEFVQQFLTKAGFDFKPLGKEVGFLALAKTSVWQRRFPRGLYVRILLDSPLDQLTVRSIYQASRGHSNHALVIINQQPELSGWGEINILHGEYGRRHFVCLPMDESVIQKGIASNSELFTLQHYIDGRLGKGFDPYDVRDPVSDAISFFGRQRLTEDLLEALQRGQRMGLFGIQKMGKSSVLQQLQKRAEFPIAYVYLTTDDELNRIYERIIDDWATNGRAKYPNFKWTRPVSEEATSFRSGFDAAVKSLLSYLSTVTETSPLLGIFLDEIEHIVPSQDDEKTLQLYVSLMDTLRGMQQETNSIALLVAGVHPSVARQNYFWGTQKNPMHQVIVEQFLPPLSNEDCSNMIRSLGKQIDLEYEKRALDYILDMSGSHPFLARQICSLAYKKGRNMSVISVEVVENVVRDFIRNPALAIYFNEYGLWKELRQPDLWEEEVGKANHLLLRRLAEASRDLSEDELCSGLDKKLAFTAFYALKERSLIVSQDNSGYYRITFGLFRNWIRFHQLGIE